MTCFHACSLVALFAGVVGSSLQAEEAAMPALQHTHEEFSLVVAAPYEKAFPLFGAWEERKWAEGFNPQFIHPSPARDQQGMVFTTENHGGTRVWTNTAFDLATGHVQYIYFAPDTMVTLIDIHLTKTGAEETRVSVVYERTALRPEANEQVSQHARGDRNSGAEWDAMINGYLTKLQNAPGGSR